MRWSLRSVAFTSICAIRSCWFFMSSSQIQACSSPRTLFDPGVHREEIGGYDPPRGTFHSPELSPEAAGSNEEHERNCLRRHRLFPNAHHDRCNVPSIVGGVDVSAQFDLTLCPLSAFLNQVLIRPAPFDHHLSHKFAVSPSERSVNRQTALCTAAVRKNARLPCIRRAHRESK
jgi:hypothetical protein